MTFISSYDNSFVDATESALDSVFGKFRKKGVCKKILNNISVLESEFQELCYENVCRKKLKKDPCLIICTHTIGMYNALTNKLSENEWRPVVAKNAVSDILQSKKVRTVLSPIEVGPKTGIHMYKALKNGITVSAALDYYYPGQRISLCNWFGQAGLTIGGLGKIALMVDVPIYLQIGSDLLYIETETYSLNHEYDLLNDLVKLHCNYAYNNPENWGFWASLPEKWSLAKAFLNKFT